MKTPWNINNNLAFEPMYDSSIAIQGAVQSTVVKACLFEDDFDDPLSDVSPSADRRTIQLFVRKHGEGGWNMERNPQRGDLITVTSWGGMPCTDVFAIEQIHDFWDSWKLSAREVKR